MKKYILIFGGLLPGLWAASQSLSSKTLVAAGTSTSAGNIRLSWTLGEPFSGTIISSSAILTVGVQQPRILTTLPVNWLFAEGRLNEQKSAFLQWKVEEQNVARYNIEKSTPGTAGRVIGEVAAIGNGTNTYNFTETVPLAREAVYRIKQIDQNGKSSYSRTIVLRNTDKGKVKLYPNPVTQSVTVFVTDPSLLATKATLVDVSGRQLQEITLETTTQIDFSAHDQGIYYLKLRNGTSLPILKMLPQ